MNMGCTSLMVFRFPKKAQTKQRASHGAATCSSLVNTGFSMSYPSFSSDTCCSMGYGGLGSSAQSSLDYAARFARSIEPIVIPPLLLHQGPGIPMQRYRRIDEDMPSPATYFSPSELSLEETFSPNEDFGENQDELMALDSSYVDEFIDFSGDATESSDNQEHLAATTDDPLPPSKLSSQNEPVPFHPEDNILDPIDFAVDHGLRATNSASLSPDVRASKKRRMSDGLRRAESISAARAALAAMS